MAALTQRWGLRFVREESFHERSKPRAIESSHRYYLLENFQPKDDTKKMRRGMSNCKTPKMKLVAKKTQQRKFDCRSARNVLKLAESFREKKLNNGYHCGLQFPILSNFLLSNLLIPKNKQSKSALWLLFLICAHILRLSTNIFAAASERALKGWHWICHALLPSFAKWKWVKVEL